MTIEIVVPESTVAISVTALYQEPDGSTTVTPRAFHVRNGRVEDETGGNSVVRAETEGED